MELSQQVEQWESYRLKADGLFARREFPDVQGISLANIILGCWTNRYTMADDVLQALDEEVAAQ